MAYFFAIVRLHKDAENWLAKTRNRNLTGRYTETLNTDMDNEDEVKRKGINILFEPYIVAVPSIRK